MERYVGKVAVVTGASSGIGLTTAQVFVRKGLIVVGLARRIDKMMVSNIYIFPLSQVIIKEIGSRVIYLTFLRIITA